MIKKNCNLFAKNVFPRDNPIVLIITLRFKKHIINKNRIPVIIIVESCIRNPPKKKSTLPVTSDHSFKMTNLDICDV